MKKIYRWALDTGTAEQVQDTRRSIAGEIGRQASGEDERFAAEMLIGEVLQTIISHDSQATTVELETTLKGWVLHVFSQQTAATEHGITELRLALSDKCDVPFSLQRTGQGFHIQVTIPASRFGLAKRHNLLQVACCVVGERARRFLYRPGART
ncbi:MAG: hypothetical protein ABR584_01700 [Candidatus Baltobacteraceae bacterium]